MTPSVRVTAFTPAAHFAPSTDFEPVFMGFGLLPAPRELEDFLDDFVDVDRLDAFRKPIADVPGWIRAAEEDSAW